MIKNIIFDMGNVLTIYNAKEHIMKYVDNDDDYNMIARQVCSSIEWIQMDRGTITDEEAIASIGKRVPLHLNKIVSRFIKEFRMDQPTNPPMEQIVKELKEAGYSLYLFSNTAHRFHQFKKNINTIPYFDGIWISCENGYLKPEERSYQSLFHTFELEPSECYFIDDSPANVEGAICLGMKGCVYHGDTNELRKHLQEVGITLS